jgi:hypothetical protein
MSDDATTIISACFDAWRAHDPTTLRALIADDATFGGPLGGADIGRAAAAERVLADHRIPVGQLLLTRIAFTGARCRRDEIGRSVRGGTGV